MFEVLGKGKRILGIGELIGIDAVTKPLKVGPRIVEGIADTDDVRVIFFC